MIKVLNFMLLSFLLTPLASAQSPANDQNPLDVVVLKFSWNRERIGWERDPFSGPLENFDEMRARSRNERRILDAKKGGSSIEVDKLKREARADEAIIARQHQNTRARYGFSYRVLFQNNGPKEITAIDWDYVFYDSISETELGRREFGSEQKIAPGKTKEVKFLISAPPARRVSVQALEKNERAGLGERIELVRIQYADGTFWQRSQPAP